MYMNKIPLEAFSSIGWTTPNISSNDEVLSFIGLLIFSLLVWLIGTKAGEQRRATWLVKGLEGVSCDNQLRTLFVWFGEKAEDRSYCSLGLPEEGSERQRCWTFPFGTHHGSELYQMRFTLDIESIYLPKGSSNSGTDFLREVFDAPNLSVVTRHLENML